MFPPFDILRVDSDGQLVWRDQAESLTLARMRVRMLKLDSPGDYIIYSQKTGHKSIIRQDDPQGEHPICPTHDTFMVPYRFQTWELSPIRPGPLDGFRCPNLDCSIVYIEPLDGFHTLIEGKLKQLQSGT
jgi:hypothetical protein